MIETYLLRGLAEIDRTGSFTAAAKALFVSQPALSRAMRKLEDELGGPLLVRRARGVEPTERGAMLLRRADDIVALADRTRDDLRAAASAGLSGTLAIGAGETPAFATVARAAAELRAANPNLKISVTSGNGTQIDEAVRAGLLDLALFVGPGRLPGYDYLVLPHVHRWGLYLRADSPLAARRTISPRHLENLPVLLSRQMFASEFLSGWLGRDVSTLNAVATFNLAYNAMALVAEGLGAAVSIDGVLPAAFARDVVFRPFRPALESDVYLAWKQGPPLTPAATALLSLLRPPA